MATRDRTQDYLAIRALQRGRNPGTRDDETELVAKNGAGPSTAIQVDAPRWVGVMHQVRQLEADASNELRQMEELIVARLKVGGGDRDLDAEERAIEMKHQAIVKIFQQCTTQVKRLDEVFKEDIVDGGSHTELSILRNASVCLAQELEALNSEVKAAKNRFLRGLEKQKDARDRFSGGKAKQEFVERMARQSMMDEYIQKGMTQEQIQTIEINTRLADEQNAEFRRILEGIKGLNEMFQDLHSLVIEQGSMLDRIDHNMTMAHQKVVQGRKQIEQAQKHLEASSFTLCILLLVVLVIGLLLAMMVKVAA